MTSSSAPPLLFCFLGATDYVPVRYQLQERTTEGPESYVQAALCQLVPCRPARALIAVTDGAFAVHGAALRKRLDDLGVPADFVFIKDGSSDDQLWETFQTLTEAIPQRSRVLFDATHGYRSLPLLGLLAIQFLRHARDITVEAVYYGAFEAIGRPGDVRAKLEREEAVGPAPILDLTPLVALPAWTEAVAAWEATGRPDQLVSTAAPFTGPIKQALRQQAPRALVELPTSLQLLGEALRLTRHDRVAPLAQQVQARLALVREELPPYPHLVPLRQVVERLAHSLAPLATSFDPSSGEGSPAYLGHQAALARWYVDHGDLAQAFAILREALASCAIACAVLAGARRAGAGWAPYPEREACLYAATRNTGKVRPARPAAPVAAALWDWLDQHPELERHFADVEEACRAARNKLSHAWTGNEHAREELTKGSMFKCRQQALKGIEALGRLIDAFTLLAAGSPLPSVDRPEPGAPALAESVPVALAPSPASAPAKRVFLNLSNHPVGGWSAEQLEAARALGLGEPADLPGGMPLVEPEADEASVEALAEQLADQALELGASGAHVAGEFTLTVALIAALQRRGVRCFAATTRREVTEQMQPDGQVRRVQMFRFVAWRGYARLDA